MIPKFRGDSERRVRIMAEEVRDTENEIRDVDSDRAPSDEEEGEDVMDSSEEDDEDDEEALQKVGEGFIVDDKEDESSKRKKRKHKKRSREESSEKENKNNDALDEDDLELMMENSGLKPQRTPTNKLKRLKRMDGTAEEEDRGDEERKNGMKGMFSDDEGEQDEKEEAPQEDNRHILDEFDDFIEEDEYSDADEERKSNIRKQQREQTRKTGPNLDFSKLSSVDRESLQQLFEVFGNGEEYEWALEAQEIEDEGAGDSGEPTSLNEVFEHAELEERMLTEDDNLIRTVDIPERFQKYRSNFNYVDFDDEELKSEQEWVAAILLKEKGSTINQGLEAPFKESIGKVVEFISKEMYEVPFIWAHRRDFLLYTEEVKQDDGNVINNVHKLLFEDDLWRILKLDIEYHTLYDKRKNTERLIEILSLDEDLVKDIKSLDSITAIQDLHDYIKFTYSFELLKAAEKVEENNNTHTKKTSKNTIYERIKENVLYDAIQAFGINAKEFGENVQDQSAKKFEVPYRIHSVDDPIESPDDLIERLCEDDEIMFKDPKSAFNAVRKTFAEEIFHNPKIRHEVRSTYKDFASISVSITNRGRSLITSHSPYADIKYLINMTPADLVRNPSIFLKMLEAESNGLVVIKVETKNYESWFQCICNCMKSDGSSEISEKWNKERELVLQIAFRRLTSMVALNTKEDIRRECERLIAKEVRRRFLAKIDQAPYTPFGFDKGTKPNVLALSFGKGDFSSAVVGVHLKDSGGVEEFFKSDDNPTKDKECEERFHGQLGEFIHKKLSQQPDVIVVSGYNANAKKLFEAVRSFVQAYNITANTEDLPDIQNPPLIQVIWGQNETAVLYQNSLRAREEFGDQSMLARYCIGLARYLQNPLLEYILLGEDILSLSILEDQKYLPSDLILESLETAFVDIVNMVGVEINEAVRDPSVAHFLSFVAGLGPRKASGLIRNINSKLGSTLVNRSDLIEHELTTACIFINCSSFLNIPYDESMSVPDSSVEMLDATRIHPEDYDLARKMAADALDLDEEDMVHVEEQGGIIHQLMQEGVSKVDELNLTAYGKELESNFGKKKYATLQSIKEELVNNFEEIRRSFHVLDIYEVFYMLTGETRESFTRNTIVPATVTRVAHNFMDGDRGGIRYIRVVTSSSIFGSVDEFHLRGLDLFQGQVVQAVVLEVNYELFTATFSLLEQDIKRASEPKFRKDPLKWNFTAENADRQREVESEKAKLMKVRNVQHPYFRNFNYKQAEEYLAPQSPGSCVLRSSSKGPDFLTVTWKVANNLFQHLSIQEISHGGMKEYVVEQKKYVDLDQLIFQHVQAIARHVNEMIHHPKFREGTLNEVNEWLESYTKANPKNSAYVFCFDHKNPGWFLILFKVNVNTPITTWHVKTETDGFRLKGFSYPNMLRLCNGFKQTFKSYAKGSSNRSRPIKGNNGYGY